jgi:hypothetical protein
MDPNWQQIASGGAVLMMFALLLWFILKLVPSWERLKIREFDTRDKEAGSRAEQAASMSQLASGIGQMSGVLKDVAVEQRKATEIVEILQRANADTQDQLLQGVRSLIGRIESIEGKKLTEDKNVHA